MARTSDHGIARRGMVAGAAALAMPRLVRAQESGTLNFVPVADLTVLDPLFAGPDVTGHHAAQVFDTLYGMDSRLVPQPQMLAGHEILDDGTRWRLTLRQGLRFHDIEPVLAADAVASLRRWGAIDVLGMKLFSITDALSAISDDVLEFRLRRPFPLLPTALAKPAAYTPYIMPARLAALAGTGKLTEMVGSGPYRFVAAERVVGARVVYARFDRYQPRPEAPSYWSGGKHAHFARVVWHVMPDAATAAASLRKGEIDWWADVPPDLGPLLARDPRLVVQVQDFIGGEMIMRFNALHPPFDNPKVRAAILPAIDQAEFMTAIAGDDRRLWRDRVGVFSLGKPMSTDAGIEVMAGDVAASRRLLAASGYQGERIVVLAVADYPSMFAAAQVGADLLRRIGFNVDLQTMDYGTQMQRRGSRAALGQGGWSVFFNWFNGYNRYDPAAHLGITSTWAGWPRIDEIEALRDRWFDAPDLAARQDIARQIQLLVWRDAPYIPLGSYYPLTAYAKGLAGVPKGGVTFFNVRRA